MSQQEFRAFTKGTRPELRAGGTGLGRVGGYALRFGKYSQNLGGFVEMIEPGALNKTLRDGGDVLCRTDHDSSRLLGRTSSGTLTLEQDEEGLDYDSPIPDTSYGRDLRALLERQDVRHSSFAFRVAPGGEEWDYTEQGFPLRKLKEVRLFDVSPVVNPAYQDTSSGLRTGLAGLAEVRGLDLDVVVKAAKANELGVLLREGSPTIIDTGRTTEPGDTHSEQPDYRSRLAKRRRELELKERTTL